MISQDSTPRSGASLAAAAAAAGITVADDKFTITGSADATKTIKFEADGQTANDDFTISAGAQTDDRTVTFPALAGAANIVVREAALTDNAVTRADGTTGKIQDSGVTIDDSNNVAVPGALDVVGKGAIGPGWAPGDGEGLIIGHSNSTFGVLTMGDAATISNDTGIYMRTTGVGHITLHGNAGSIRISTDGSHANGLLINSSGNLSVTSGNTITVPSGIIFANETLAHYDEGTWTPAIAGDSTAGSQTYSTQTGTYTRVGRLVTAFFNIVMTNKDGTTAGNVTITGLPFTPASERSGAGIAEYANITFVGLSQLTVRAVTGLTSLYLGAAGTAAAMSNIAASGIANNTQITGSIQFEV